MQTMSCWRVVHNLPQSPKILGDPIFETRKFCTGMRDCAAACIVPCWFAQAAHLPPSLPLPLSARVPLGLHRAGPSWFAQGSTCLGGNAAREGHVPPAAALARVVGPLSPDSIYPAYRHYLLSCTNHAVCVCVCVFARARARQRDCDIVACREHHVLHKIIFRVNQVLARGFNAMQVQTSARSHRQEVIDKCTQS